VNIEEEIEYLSNEAITASVSDDHYREAIVSFVSEAAKSGDVDTLRVYRNVIRHPDFTPATLTFKYANYAMIVLRDLGHKDTASLLTPETLHSFEIVIRARQDALGKRGWIMGDGNDKLLMELIERPESEPILLHLLQDRGITNADQLLIQTAESLNVSLPLHRGAL
jgi:hypothetical protein